MQSVALIDYGSGNLRSAEKALVRAADGRANIVVTSDPEVVAAADRVMLPGVGAFAACMKALGERPGLIEGMTQAVQAKGVRVTVISTQKTQPPHIADELRRQADAFLDLNDLTAEFGRPKTSAAQ